MTSAIESYIKEVKSNAFPEDKHCYHMIKGEEEKFQSLKDEY